jgi:polyisoprenoid-binding protein YceI
MLMYGYSKMSQNKAEQEVNSYLNQAQPESLAEQNLNQQQPALNTQDTNTQTTTTSTTATAAAFTGSVALTPQNTKLAWIGRKTLVVGYEDAGKIDITSGSAELKDGKVVSATAKIDMNSINVIKSGKGSDEDRLTGHLKSPDFFDAEKYPTAELKITQAKLISEAAGVQNYEFSGTLNMKGVTVAVSFPGKVTFMGNSIKLESETKLYPELVALLKDHTGVIPGGETYEEFSKRIQDALYDVAMHSPYSRIAIVSHGGPMSVLFRDILRKGEITYQNCSFVEISFDAGIFSLVHTEGVTVIS